ncbi:MAG: hypothetical protein R3C68_08645 [Myxococcota bacterium]
MAIGLVDDLAHALAATSGAKVKPDLRTVATCLASSAVMVSVRIDGKEIPI